MSSKADEAAAERVLKAGVRRAIELLRTPDEWTDDKRAEATQVLTDATNAARLVLGEKP